MNHASLFSGIGGFDLASSWMGWENVFQCEIDPFCQQVLKHHFPTTTHTSDVHRLMVDGNANLIYCDCDGSQESKICLGCEVVRARAIYSGDSGLVWSNETGDVENLEKKECEVSSELAVQIRESLLQRKNKGERLCSECTGICSAEGDSGEEDTLRRVREHGFIQGWEKRNTSTSRQLQRTTESQMAMPEMSSSLAQDSQSNFPQITHDTSHPFRRMCCEGHSVICRRGDIDILTGGVPCQPASAAGKRKGTSDDRWLWPEAFRILRELKPTFAVFENVRGLTSLEQGMVFNSLLSELEENGYEVQPFCIPACAVGAPHKRERIWFVAHNKYERQTRRESKKRPRPEEGIFERGDCDVADPDNTGLEGGEEARDSGSSRKDSLEQSGGQSGCDVTNPKCNVYSRTERGINAKENKVESLNREEKYPTRKPRRADSNGRGTGHEIWKEGWLQAATRLCRVDDGLPRELDGISVPKWRKESLKAYGNAIVPQVAYEIFQSIDTASKQTRV